MLGGCLQKWVKFEGLVKLSQKVKNNGKLPFTPKVLGNFRFDL
jgi:hypothetical protein